MTADGGEKTSTTADIFAGKKVVLFGVPGAFTPTCSNNHLPGYLENHDAILARGVDTIAVLATNDVHVMGAWARFTGGEGKILFLADGSGGTSRAPPPGLDVDFDQERHGLPQRALLADRRGRRGQVDQRREQAGRQSIQRGGHSGTALSGVERPSCLSRTASRGSTVEQLAVSASPVAPEEWRVWVKRRRASQVAWLSPSVGLAGPAEARCSAASAVRWPFVRPLA